MVEISLLCDRVRWEEKELSQASYRKGVKIKIIDPKNLYLGVPENHNKLLDQIGEIAIQRCVSYFRGLHTTAIVENANIEVINSFDVLLTCGNKLFTTLALSKANIQVPRTLAAFSEEGVSKALEELGYPTVIKPVIGSWGRLIALIKDKETARAIVESREQMSNSLLQIYYLQEYVDRPPRDIRILVVGEEAVAASYRYQPSDDWRTNVARGGISKPCKITEELEDLAIKSAHAVGGGVLAIDCMESSNGILVNEVNSTVEFRGLSSVTNVNIPNKIINFALEVNRK